MTHPRIWLCIAVVLLTTKAARCTSRWEKIQHATSVFLDVFLGKHSLAYAGQKKGLSVIGAGFPRTGTKSIEAALASLGHRIYDTRSCIENEHSKRWVKAAEDWKLRNDLTELESLVSEMEASGYTATLDLPLMLFAEPLALLRPKAKVLLSVRDNPDQWYRSFAYINTIFGPFLYCRPWIWFMPDFLFSAPIIEVVFGIRSIDLRVNSTSGSYITNVFPWYDKVHFSPFETEAVRQQWIAAYENHSKNLQKAIPEDRLLVFNVKQGWDPLVEFLDIDNPALISEDFPHVNEQKYLEVVRKCLTIFAIGFPFWILSLVLVFTFFVRACFRVLRSCWKTPESKIKSD